MRDFIVNIFNNSKKVVVSLLLIFLVIALISTLNLIKKDSLQKKPLKRESTQTEGGSLSPNLNSEFGSINELREFFGQPPNEPIKSIEIIKEITKIKKIDTTERGDVLFFNNSAYQLVYFSKEDQYLISILSSPFDDIRDEAEKKFVEVLETDKETACILNVVVSSPYNINPAQGAKKFGLSWCGQ